MGEAHAACLSSFVDALRTQVSTICVDNEFPQPWRYRIYQELAGLMGYSCQVLELTCPDVATAQAYHKRSTRLRSLIGNNMSPTGQKLDAKQAQQLLEAREQHLLNDTMSQWH